MKILNPNYSWANGLTTRGKTDAIVVHHRAGNGDVMSIHNLHINQNGWSGIGYHFYVRKNGDVFRGRPIDKMGAHASGHNSHTIGICFEGNFEKEKMSNIQIESGRELIKYIREYYKSELPVLKHSDVCATSCPGKLFPFDEITSPILVSNDDTVNRMYIDGIITKENIGNWEAFLSGKSTPKPEYIRTIIERYQDKI